MRQQLDHLKRLGAGPSEGQEPMHMLQVLALLFLCLTIVLCGGTILWYLVVFSSHTSRVEEIRRLRQEGLAVNQEGEQ